MADKLLTITKIAKKIDIAESTVRYYRDRFEKYIPSVGEGRQKRYKPEAVDILRLIAEGFKRNQTATEIEDELSRQYAVNIDFLEEPQESQITTAAAQQQSNQAVFLAFQKTMEQMAAVLEKVADQEQEIKDLRLAQKRQDEEIKHLHEDVLERLEERDRKLMEHIRNVQESKKTFWQRLFNR